MSWKKEARALLVYLHIKLDEIEGIIDDLKDALEDEDEAAYLEAKAFMERD